MNIRGSMILMLLWLVCRSAEGQVANPGTIKVEKPDTMTTKIPAYNFMMNGRHFRAVYPDNMPAIYPGIVYNKGLLMMDVNRNVAKDKVVQFDYRIFTGDSIPSSQGTLTYLIDFFPRMYNKGAYVIISNLSFKDSNGKVHVGEIPAFMMVRVD